MSGIVFFRTRRLEEIREFYTRRAGMEVWLDQGDVSILKEGNLLVGFHQAERADLDGLITFFCPDRMAVDRMYERFAVEAKAPPRVNEKYRIYHFFAADPEGRGLEFQSFEHAIGPHLDGAEILATRRSVRRFVDRAVEGPLLDAIFESCRLAPSARNSQPCSFIVVRDRERLARLAALRGESSAPIARAPVAVAVTSDPAISPRHVQDGCIATYHLILAAWAQGLGTCWIGGMDRPEAKQILDVPEDQYLVTVTPLGYPAERPVPGDRTPARVRFLDS